MKKLLSLIIVSTLVISCNNVHENIVMKSKITANKEYAGFECNKLNDNDINTYWNSGSYGENWVDFSFEKPTDISNVKFSIVAMPACTFKYDIMTKEEGKSDYENANSGFKYINSKDSIESKLDKKKITNVKVVLHTDSSWSNIMNIEIFN